jgi:hypothetical protein
MTEQVIDRIEEFCRVLRTNYQDSAIARHRDAIAKMVLLMRLMLIGIRNRLINLRWVKV